MGNKVEKELIKDIDGKRIVNVEIKDDIEITTVKFEEYVDFDAWNVNNVNIVKQQRRSFLESTRNTI